MSLLLWLEKQFLLTRLKIVQQTYPDLTIRMSCNRQPCLAVDIPLTQIHIPFRTRIDNFDICTLVRPRANVRSNDNKCICVGLVPYTLFGGVPVRWQVEFNGGCARQNQ